MAEWGAYTVRIYQRGALVREIEFRNMSGHAMMDMVYGLRFDYPIADGYAIDW